MAQRQSESCPCAPYELQGEIWGCHTDDKLPRREVGFLSYPRVRAGCTFQRFIELRITMSLLEALLLRGVLE